MEDGENGAKRLWNGYTRENIDSLKEKSVKKLKMSLDRVEKKDGEAAIIGNCWILKDKSIGDKVRSHNLVKKVILKGSAGHNFPKNEGCADTK